MEKMKIFEFDGVKFNLEALKGYTKSQFVKQNKARFKDAGLVWDMMKDKIPAVKKSKSKSKFQSRLNDELQNKAVD